MDSQDLAENDSPASPLLPTLRKQSELALVAGVPYTALPDDLYIPPDALEVFLEAFEGPLDLLLYLIKRQNLDILDIRVADITQQYMQYIDLMTELQFELAAEYLVMAAMLAEIKSRMLLPRQAAGETEEDDPRAELIRRLQEYEQFKSAALNLDELPRSNRDFGLLTRTHPCRHGRNRYRMLRFRNCSSRWGACCAERIKMPVIRSVLSPCRRARGCRIFWLGFKHVGISTNLLLSCSVLKKVERGSS